jgi:hypothetical protein
VTQAEKEEDEGRWWGGGARATVCRVLKAIAAFALSHLRTPLEWATPRPKKTSTASCLYRFFGNATPNPKLLFFSHDIFRYINPLLALGLKRQLNTDDLPPVSSADQAKLGVKLLDEHWSYERSLTALEPSLYRSL